jgi:Na+-driven multidrug efflux pump
MAHPHPHSHPRRRTMSRRRSAGLQVPLVAALTAIICHQQQQPVVLVSGFSAIIRPCHHHVQDHQSGRHNNIFSQQRTQAMSIFRAGRTRCRTEEKKDTRIFGSLLGLNYRTSADDDSDETTTTTAVSTSNEVSKSLSSSSSSSGLFGDNNSSIEAAIWSLALPAFIGEVIDPLLGLVDTAFIGHFSAGDGSAALAGVGSATALLNFSFFVFNFLTAVTTPLVASRRAANQPEEARAVAGQALSLALLLGVGMSTLLITFREPLLGLMGTANTGPEASAFAQSFLTIRALAAPAVFTISASTGILRGYMDSKTPVMVLLTANILNFALDVVFILGFKLGPTGAALATTAAEWISALTLLALLSGKLPNYVINIPQQQNENNVNAENDNENADNNSVPVVAVAAEAEALQVVPILEIPQWEDVKPLLVASGSIFLRSVSLQAFLAGAAAMAARGDMALQGSQSGLDLDLAETSITSTMTAANVAAHQVALQLWLLCSFICDALAAASQVLVADATGRGDPAQVRHLSGLVMRYGLILGAVLAALLQLGFSTGILLELFTPEHSSTAVALLPLVPILVFVQPLNAMVFTLDGVLQGASQFPYQAKSMVLSVGGGIAALLILNQFDTDSNTLVHVWESFCVLQMGRLITSLHKMVDKEGPINILER